MLCPWCEHNNLSGEDLCGNCMQDLTQLDRPVPLDRVERSLMDDPVGILQMRIPKIVSPTDTIDEVMQCMLANNIGAVLVVDATQNIVGIFSERDLLVKIAGSDEDLTSHPVSDFMTRRPETIRDTDSLAFALHKMDCGGYRHLPVLRDGVLLGMVSVRDMIEHITAICAGCSTLG